MTMANIQPAVVMKAFTWAYEELGLTCSDAAQMLGISEQALHQTALVGFEPRCPENQTQRAFIRLYHQLYTLSDGDTDSMCEWFHRYNPQLGGVPKHICSELAGIQCVYDVLSNVRTLRTAAPLHCPAVPVLEPSKGIVAQP